MERGINSLELLSQEKNVPFISVPDLPISAAGLFLLQEIFPQPEIYNLDYIANLEPKYLREYNAQIQKHKN
jgi:hypothetical protein